MVDRESEVHAADLAPVGVCKPYVRSLPGGGELSNKATA
jgi:hypothetical protein